MKFLTQNLIWPPLVFTVGVFLLAAIFYFLGGQKNKRLQKILIPVYLFFVLVLALSKSILQYRAWQSSDFGKLLLPPYQSIKYFLFYSFTHFWFGALVGLAAAALFYLFLRRVAKNRDWLFIEGEQELGFLCALLSGWPGFVIFLPLVFIIMLPLSLFRRLVLKEERTTMGAALILAAGAVLLLGNWLISWLGLGVLRI